MEATRTTFIIFRTVVCEKKSISQFDFRTSPMIKFYQQTNVNFFERLNQFSNLFHFHFFLFKIKTPGKHLSFTHAHVHAGKEFTWFQRNDKSNYHLTFQQTLQVLNCGSLLRVSDFHSLLHPEESSTVIFGEKMAFSYSSCRFVERRCLKTCLLHSRAQFRSQNK